MEYDLVIRNGRIVDGTGTGTGTGAVAFAGDIAAQVAHCAVRTCVTGARGARNDPATPEDIARMAAIVRGSQPEPAQAA